MSATCRCTCQAYGGACDCRFDGLSVGRREGAAEERARVVAWLLLVEGLPREIAHAIRRGEHRVGARGRIES